MTTVNPTSAAAQTTATSSASKLPNSATLAEKAGRAYDTAYNNLLTAYEQVPPNQADINKKTIAFQNASRNASAIMGVLQADYEAKMQVIRKYDKA